MPPFLTLESRKQRSQNHIGAAAFVCPSTGYLGKEYINRKSETPALPDGRTSFNSSRSLASDMNTE